MTITSRIGRIFPVFFTVLFVTNISLGNGHNLNQPTKTEHSIVYQFLLESTSDDNKIDEEEFSAALRLYGILSNNTLDEEQRKAFLKQLILTNEWNIKQGWFKGGSWFSDIQLTDETHQSILPEAELASKRTSADIITCPSVNALRMTTETLSYLEEFGQFVLALEPGNETEQLTFQHLVIEKQMNEKILRYFYWAILISSAAVVTYLSAGLLAPYIGGLIGGLMGFHGVCAVNAGLAFLGGGALGTGALAFGMAGGTAVVSVISDLAVGVAIDRGFAYLEDDAYQEVKEIIEEAKEDFDLTAYARSLTLLKNFSESNPRQLPLTKYYTGLVFFDLGRQIAPEQLHHKNTCFSMAESLFNNILEHEPNSSIAFYHLANIASQRFVLSLDPRYDLSGDHPFHDSHENAIGFYKTAIDAEQKNHEPYIALANLYRLDDSPSMAIPILAQYLALNVNYHDAKLFVYQLLGACHHEVGDIKNSLKYFTLAYDYQSNEINLKALSDIYYRILVDQSPDMQIDPEEFRKKLFNYTRDFLDALQDTEDNYRSNVPGYAGGQLVRIHKDYYERILDLAVRLKEHDKDYKVKKAAQYFNSYHDLTGDSDLDGRLVEKFREAVRLYNVEAYFDLSLNW